MTTVFERGVSRTISANFNGKVYGPIIWTASPAASIALVPGGIPLGTTVSATAKPDAPAGAVSLSVSSLNSKGQKIGGTLAGSIAPVVVVPPPPAFAFKYPTRNDVITDQATAAVTLLSVPAGGELNLFNVKGNGATIVTTVIPGMDGSNFQRREDLDAKYGGPTWADNHSNGDTFVLIGCASFVINPHVNGGSTGDTGTPPPPIVPPPPVVIVPQFTITAKKQADGTMLLNPAIPNYYMQALPDGNFVAQMGDMQEPEAGVRHLPAHRVEILDALNNVIVGMDMPAHYWGSQAPFRPQGNQPKIIRTPAQLVAGCFSFPHGDVPGCSTQAPWPQPYGGPMNVAASGICAYMPQTGERPDLGEKQDNSGWFMYKGVGGETNMLSWAEACCAWPLHAFDKTTLSPINLLNYPHADMTDLPGYHKDQPYLWKGPRDPKNGYPSSGGGMSPQQAHFGDSCFIAAAATGDLIYALQVQYGALFCIFSNAEISDGAPVAIISGEHRGIAWARGMVAKAYKITKDLEDRGVLPLRGFLPSSVFLTLHQNTLAYYSLDIGKPIMERFGVLAAMTTPVGAWQQCYLNNIGGLEILFGLDYVLPLYLKSLRLTVEMNDGSNGWAGYGTPYYFDLFDNNKVLYANSAATLDGFLKTELENEATAAGHGEVYTPQITQAQYDALKKDPTNGGFAMTGQGYDISTRATLVEADYLDRLGPSFARGTIRSMYPTFDAALKNVCTRVKNAGFMQPKVSIIAP